MTDADRIAAFLAKRAPTVIPEGVATMDNQAWRERYGDRGLTRMRDESETDGARQLERGREETGYYRS